jgi:hypothetical protein
MKRFQLVVLVSAIAAGAIWYGFYRSGHSSSLGVASLLPKETLALLHVADFNRSRAEWHRTDIYQLWKEPAVQDFLAKPRASVPTQGRIGQTVEEISSIEMKDAFVALVALEHSAWKMVGGFRCGGDAEKAEKLVENWRTKLFADAPDVKQETADHQGRQIRIDSAGVLNLATVRSGNWFFFANDVERLKSLLDRAEGRVKDPQTALSGDDAFLAASNHMPSNYAGLAYARVDRLVEKLMPATEKPAGSPDQMAMLRQIRSFCGTTTFDGGKMRDRLFIGMPKVADLGNLARASLPIGTKDTFLYAASLLNLTKEMELTPQLPTFGWLGGVQRITGALSGSGITLDEWKSAFGPELGLLGNWPPNSQWPALFIALPVSDPAKANKIVATLTTANGDGAEWTHQEKEGVHYYSSASRAQLFSFSPTIGVSDRMLVAGADPGSVEAAMRRSATGSSELAATRNFQTAERAVPTAHQAFAYVDPALLYTRIDATLRPLLIMGAAFVPGIADTLDLSKLPPADVITKHLSPIVMSQSYERDGYLAESVGPVPLYQTILGAVTTGSAAAAIYRRQTQGAMPSPSTLSAPPASPSPSPEDSP